MVIYIEDLDRKLNDNTIELYNLQSIRLYFIKLHQSIQPLNIFGYLSFIAFNINRNVNQLNKGIKKLFAQQHYLSN